MNADRLLQLATMLDTGVCPIYQGKPVGFNMSYMDAHKGAKDNTKKGCGTAACIAGWTVLLWGTDLDRGDPDDSVAAEILGLDYCSEDRPFSTLADRLFYPSLDKDWEKITPKQAAKVIRNLVKTGEVEW